MAWGERQLSLPPPRSAEFIPLQRPNVWQRENMLRPQARSGDEAE